MNGLPEGALEGVKILDLTWVLSGPYASMVLCDLGAEVIKVERPPYGDVARTTGPFLRNELQATGSKLQGEGAELQAASAGLQASSYKLQGEGSGQQASGNKQQGVGGAVESSYFFSINRGKKSTLLDLRKAEGRELFLRLVEKVDVVMENFTPGTMDRLGLGYEALAARNPRVIYSATSGFGQTGPDRDKPALDVVVQGMGGVMSITGEEGGGPVRPGLSLGDIAAGLFTAIGILAALQERERSGRGQMIDISMLDCQVAILENAFARYSATGEPPRAIGTRHPLSTPFQAFPTADGHIVIALGFGLENIWGLFCATIDRPELIDDPRFQTPGERTRNHAVLEPMLNEAMLAQPTSHWVREFEAIQLPCGPLNSIPEVAAYPQVVAREMLREVASARGNRLTIANSPLRLSRTPGVIRGGPPAPGQDTRAVLGEVLGMDEGEIEAAFEVGAAVEARELPGEITGA
ncbi:MAG TPA: CaiB/BaiF CoA-transferase family protein [Dehalococcoidia bacterium]|nr:CaiB/BaiF CoA-transferase family protein [Dehalococcoidia bacterium]